MSTAEEIIRALALEPLAIEGGFFRETYRSRESISGSELPPEYPRDARRSLATSIYYLLTPNTFSEMHRLPTDGDLSRLQGRPGSHASTPCRRIGTGGLARHQRSGRPTAPAHRSGGRMARVVAGAGRRVRASGHDDDPGLRLCRLRARPPGRPAGPISGPWRVDHAVNSRVMTSRP